MVTDAQGHFKSNAFAAVLSQLPDSEEAKDGDREAELRNVLEACKTQADLPLLIFCFSRHECMPRMMPMVKLQCTLQQCKATIAVCTAAALRGKAKRDAGRQGGRAGTGKSKARIGI